MTDEEKEQKEKEKNEFIKEFTSINRCKYCCDPIPAGRYICLDCFKLFED